MAKTVSMDRVKGLINYFIDRNFKLEEEGKRPIALSLEAEPGIGKTSIIEQVAKERGMGFTKLNVAQLEETGDILGFPLTEYECQIAKRVKDENGNTKIEVLPKTVWLSSKQLDTMEKGMFRQTGRTRMGYAKPTWVPEYNENGTIFLLDDYVRGSQQLLQALMEVFIDKKFVSWSLPKKTVICLTNNPDDGTNNVNSLDPAQRSRFFNFNLVFDVNAWATWAEKEGIDGRCINFVMNYADELFKADDEGNRICNPRSFVMFANAIAGIKDWDDPENLNFISLIASGCFEDAEGRFSSMFATFIRNKMHLIIQPKEMLLGAWDTVKEKLGELLYGASEQYRPDIASLLERRFVNYVNAWLDSEEQTPIAKVKQRILDFIDYGEKNKLSDGRNKMLFNKDMFYHMIKTITSDHKRQTSNLLFDPKIANLIH